MLAEIKTFLIAMSPIVELRGAIPYALEVYQLPIWSAYLFSVLGNLVPLILIILLLEPISFKLSKRFNLFKKFFDWLFLHTRQKNNRFFEKIGPLAVVILVATPIPLIGGWTGAVAAFVFGLPFKRALPLVILGAMLAGLIVTFLSIGFFKLIII